MGVGGGAGRAAGVAAGVGCDPCKSVEKKSWASGSSFWDVDGLGSATKLRAGVFSTGAAALAGARRRLVMLSAPPASAAKKSFASAASFWDVVGDGAVALGDGVPLRALRRSIVRLLFAGQQFTCSELLGVPRGVFAQGTERQRLQRRSSGAFGRRPRKQKIANATTQKALAFAPIFGESLAAMIPGRPGLADPHPPLVPLRRGLARCPIT